MPSDVAILFQNKLKLNTVDSKLQIVFAESIRRYLEHSRRDGVVEGRTYQFLEQHLNELTMFFDAIELSTEERIIVITNMPSIINTSSDILSKYLLLGAIENEDNSFRRRKLVEKTNDFRIGLKKLYGRYVLATEAGYPDINWNLLVHSSDREFSSRFIKSKYSKKYQFFENEEQVLKYLDEIPFEGFNIEMLKSWDVNREIVEYYEEKRSSK